MSQNLNQALINKSLIALLLDKNGRIGVGYVQGLELLERFFILNTPEKTTGVGRTLTPRITNTHTIRN